MSIISRLYDATAVTEREGWVDVNKIKRAYVSNLTAFACHVQPLEAELAQTLPGGIGKNWLMFCSNLDIKENDKLIVNDTTEYRVAGIETYTHSRNPHMEVILTSFKN